MKWFGKDWGAPVCEKAQHVPTPVGTACYLCGKPIAESHRGFVLPFMGGPEDTPEVTAHFFCFGQSVGIHPGD